MFRLKLPIVQPVPWDPGVAGRRQDTRGVRSVSNTFGAGSEAL
jgi:hypothetical protein